jgi:adsorption protein A
MAFNLYMDAAHYVRSEQTSATADLRASLHRKIESRQTFEPYAHFQVSGVRTFEVQRDVRLGGGARWNLWHGRSRYSADYGKLSLGVEAQRALETYLPERTGVYLTLSTRW